MNTEKETQHAPDLNPDPITGAPGSHPVGTGVGAAGGAAAGAAIGAVGGPVGVAVGGVIGAVVGGLAGKGVAEQIDPTVENAYWESEYRNQPYYESDFDYGDYGPAYRTGWQHSSLEGTFEESEPRLREDWENTKGESRLSWEKAKYAARSSWERAKDSMTGK